MTAVRARRTPKKGERVWPERRTLPPAIAAALREARQARGLGLREAARRVGVWPGYLCLLEQGKRCPSLAVAQDLVDELGLNRVLALELLALAPRDAGRSRQTTFGQQQRRERAAAEGRLPGSLAGLAQRAATTSRPLGSGSE